MTLILTEAECLALTVRGDVPGVLDGYVGPVLTTARLSAGVPNWPGAVSGPSVRGKWWVGRGEKADGSGVNPWGSTPGQDYGRVGEWSASNIALPLASPLVQAHLVGWLGRGQPCPGPCVGVDCGRCDGQADGTGRGRARGHNRYSWLTPEAHEGLPDWIRMALIWGSVVRVAAGAGPLRDVVAPWSADESASGRPGADQANQRMMGLGHALIDETPTGRVIRFEVPDGR